MSSPEAEGAVAKGERSFTPKEYKGRIRPIWCPGCGNFALLSALTGALSDLAIPPETLSLVSGVFHSSAMSPHSTAVPRNSTRRGLHTRQRGSGSMHATQTSGESKWAARYDY